MTRDDVVFDRRTLRERCTAHVRDQIVSGAIAPGEHLVETRLAGDLGVSRGTLREALRPLEEEGLLVGDGRGHLMVRELSSGEILEVFDVRLALEGLAVRRLTEREDRGEVVASLDEALAALNDESLSFAERIEADLSFHARICELTDNWTLVRSWQRLRGQIEMMIIAVGPQVGGSRMRYDEHRVIVDAIATGDVRAAMSAIDAHMDDFCHRYTADAMVRELGAGESR